jgi:hypothetical protein
MRDPIVILKRALYGHPIAGNCWHNHLVKMVITCGAGFELVSDAWPSTFFSVTFECVLVVYVDDFRLAGPVKFLPPVWKMLAKLIDISTPEPWGRFLGAVQVLRRLTDFIIIEYDMTEYLDTCLQRYRDVSGIQKLQNAQTPFLEESKLELELFEKPGVLADASASILMSFPWLARMARWDILRQIGVLASCISRWTLANDLQLHRALSGFNAFGQTYYADRKLFE